MATQPLRLASSIRSRSWTPLMLHVEVLQPEVAEVVAARDQEMKLGVMAGAEERAGLSHHPAVELDDLGPDLQGAGRFRDQIQEGRRISRPCRAGSSAGVRRRSTGCRPGR